MAERILPTEAQAPASIPHAYNDPNLSPIEFLQAVYRDASLPMSIRIDAARGLLPYTEPKPARIPSSDVSCTIIIPPFEPRTADHEAHEGDNGKSQSFPEIANNICQPLSGGPGPSNMMTIPEPSPFIDYSQPHTPEELQAIKAVINRLRPGDAHLPIPEFHLCPCGHWITGTYPCCERNRDPSKMN